MTLFWGLLFLIFIFIEIITINLVTIWFAFGSLITVFVSLYFDSIIIQTVVFILASLLGLVLTKPITSKLKAKKFEPTNLDRFIGKSGVVIKKISYNQKGEVKVLDTIWSAISDDELEVGDKVIVEKIEGVKLIVKKEKK